MHSLHVLEYWRIYQTLFHPLPSTKLDLRQLPITRLHSNMQYTNSSSIAIITSHSHQPQKASQELGIPNASDHMDNTPLPHVSCNDILCGGYHLRMKLSRCGQIDLHVGSLAAYNAAAHTYSNYSNNNTWIAAFTTGIGVY